MGQLPHLAKAYARFKDQGFEILSFSFDEKREDLLAARTKHKIPWLQGLDPALKGFEGDFDEKLHVWGFPTAYLVSAGGTILAREWEIDDGRLESILEKYLQSGTQ